MTRSDGGAMSGFIGLDPEQVTDFSEKLQAAAKKIDSIGLNLGVQVRQEWIWQGADAEEFRQRWTGEVLQQFSDREGLFRISVGSLSGTATSRKKPLKSSIILIC